MTLTNITYPAFALCALACFALSPQARAVCQQGCDTNQNTANGVGALSSNTTGSKNIAIGVAAGINLTTGSNNIFIAGIRGIPITGGISVGVGSSGQVGVAPSSQRFKEAVEPMDKASEAILALKPVTFRYKHDLDPDGVPQFGLVAEDVEEVCSRG